MSRSFEIPPELRQRSVRVSPAYGLGLDRELRRHDASNILLIDGAYHVWYTRYGNNRRGWRDAFLTPGHAEIWLATSSDGRHWTERGSVFPVVPGGWCNRGRHAPHIVPHNGSYYLFFTAFSGADDQKRHLGLAISGRPGGPFTLCMEQPILSPLLGSDLFDSWVVDDACVIVRNGLFGLYYKDRSHTLSPRETLIDVAFAEQPEGPYRRWEGNPLFCGHTACVWPHRRGVAAIADNPPRSVQYSDDGLHFRKACDLVGHMEDIGVYCPDAFHDTTRGIGISWGLTLQFGTEGRERRLTECPSEHLARIDCDMAVSESDRGDA